MTAQADQESYSFQAEVVQILDLMIHSLYSNKEIFLRELISNASDAIDRLRLELMGQGESPEADGPLQIRVSFDAEARTITVADNGIGMSHDEVVEHIGTIAKSGTRENSTRSRLPLARLLPAQADRKELNRSSPVILEPFRRSMAKAS